MKVSLRFFVQCAVMFAVSGGVAAEELTAREIVHRAETQMRGSTSTGVYEMTIANPDWQRTLTMRFWDDADGDRSFIRITDPPRERGTASLRLGNEMWTYLPSVERSMKIPPSMMAQSWMGSDLTNDDIVNADDYVNQYVHELIDTTSIDEERVYVIRSTPKPEAPVVWDQITYYARASDFLPVRQDFFDEDSTVVRRMVFTEFRDIGGRVIPTRYTVEPLTEDERGNRTVLKIAEIEFDAPIRDDIFTRRNLERAR